MMNLDRAKELQSSLLWADICEEINIKIFHLAETLKTCKAEDLVNIQKEIRVYESVKRLPQDIVDREESPK
jgi:hypothetical protein